MPLTNLPRLGASGLIAAGSRKLVSAAKRPAAGHAEPGATRLQVTSGQDIGRLLPPIGLRGRAGQNIRPGWPRRRRENSDARARPRESDTCFLARAANSALQELRSIAGQQPHYCQRRLPAVYGAPDSQQQIGDSDANATRVSRWLISAALMSTSVRRHRRRGGEEGCAEAER